VITKCCHGTRELSGDEIRRTYGEERRWEPVSEFIEDPLSIQYGKKLAERLYSFADYTDAQASLVFAKTIDGIDSHSSQPPSTYQVSTTTFSSFILPCLINQVKHALPYS
jgi:hypothetical protein